MSAIYIQVVDGHEHIQAHEEGMNNITFAVKDTLEEEWIGIGPRPPVRERTVTITFRPAVDSTMEVLKEEI